MCSCELVTLCTVLPFSTFFVKLSDTIENLIFSWSVQNLMFGSLVFHVEHHQNSTDTWNSLVSQKNILIHESYRRKQIIHMSDDTVKLSDFDSLLYCVTNDYLLSLSRQHKKILPKSLYVVIVDHYSSDLHNLLKGEDNS